MEVVGKRRKDGATMVNIYNSMYDHPDTGPVMKLLELVEQCDEFSKGVVLVRDCFSPNNTLRALSRRKLRAILGERTGLMEAYQTVVYEAARKHGAKPKSYLHAVSAIPIAEFKALRDAYNAQVNALMGR